MTPVVRHSELCWNAVSSSSHLHQLSYGNVKSKLRPMCAGHNKLNSNHPYENVKQYDLIIWLFECNMGSVVYLTKCAGWMFFWYWTLFYMFSVFCFLWWSMLTSIPFTVTPTQSARESSEVQDELSEKVDRLKAELVVFKSLMSDVSVCPVMSPSPPWAAGSFHTPDKSAVLTPILKAIMLAVFEACTHRRFLIRAAIHTGLHTHTHTHTHTPFLPSFLPFLPPLKNI